MGGEKTLITPHNHGDDGASQSTEMTIEVSTSPVSIAHCALTFQPADYPFSVATSL